MIVEILFEENDPRLIIVGIGAMIVGISLMAQNVWIELGEKIPAGALVLGIGFVILMIGLNNDFRGIKTKHLKKNLNKKTMIWMIVMLLLLVGFEAIFYFF